MYILKNSLANLLRNRGRNILMSVIILTIITTTVVALAINNTSSGIIDDYKNRYGTEVTINLDIQSIISQQNPGGSGGGPMAIRRDDFPSVTPQQYIDFADSQYIKEYVMTAFLPVSSESINSIDEDEEQEDGRTGGTVITGGGGAISFSMPEMRIIGNSWTEFNDGSRALVEGGKMPENDNECIISQELADLNGIKQGDTIEVTMTAMSAAQDNETSEQQLQLTVTGIYADMTDEYTASGMFKSAFMNRRNEVLTNLSTLTNLVSDAGDAVNIQATYYLNNPSQLAAFDAELREKGLDPMFKVSADEESYNRSVGPVEGMRNISLIFMLIVIILGAMILFLLNSIAIRERKYEVGVLRAMGMKKSRVAMGLWSEMLILTFMCAMIGLGIGAAASQPISDAVLQQQIQSAEQGNNTMPGGGMRMVMVSPGGRSSADVEPLSELDVSVDLMTIGEILLISALLATLASAASVTRITKYEPIKILMERN